MRTEDEFLKDISELLSGGVLLSATLRWGSEGVFEPRVDLGKVAVKLQENLETAIRLLETRRSQLRRDSA